MPVEIAPNRIELDDLSGGFAPDVPESSLTPNASPDMLNLLPEPASKSPETRKGFERLAAGRLAGLAHTVKNLYYYEVIVDRQRQRYIMAILSDGTDGADNVQVWAYDLLLDSFDRVDDSGRTWENSKAPHWGAVISGTYYGGGRGDVIYSWHPTDGWKADPTSDDEPKRWVDAINDSVNTATERARDYAYKKRDKVVYDGGAGDEIFSVTRDIRYPKWNDDEQYKKGDRVSRKHVWASTSSYWKSFECITAHRASTGSGESDPSSPGTGKAWHTFWKKIRLDNIFDEDDELNKGWRNNNSGMKSSVGVFYADRLFIRRDNEDERSLVQYSAPLDVSATKDGGKHPERIADLVFDPTDWAAVDDIDGEGGGHFYVLPGQGDAVRDMHEMGNYLVIAKRWRSAVLAGRTESTWSLRKLGDYGVVALNCMTEADGLVYGLSHTGTLWVTDGTSQREVEGFEKAREYIKERIDRLLEVTPEDDDEQWMPQLWSYQGRVFISLPDIESGGTDDVTIVYDPPTTSWWRLDLPILSAVTGAKTRSQRMWFGAAHRAGEPTVFEYGDDPGNLVFTDDDPQGGASPLTTAIPWYYKSAWFQFGLAHVERRVRRTWALVKTAVSVTVAGYRDFASAATYTVTRSAGSNGSTFIEGKSFGRPAHAVALKVSGTAATGGPAVIGLGIDTQPIRTRFHRNS